MNFPPEFISLTQQILSNEEWAKFSESMAQASPVSIRVNASKIARYGVNLALDGVSNVPWCEAGFYLPSRPTFTFDPLFHAGAYYVQEASSMFIGEVLKQHLGSPENATVLDLCAAPGGKTTLLRSLLPSNSLLVANEIVTKRAFVLSENLLKWGHPNVVVTNNRSDDFTPLKSMFDLVLADVPCSGEGMFRKDEVAIQEWSPNNVEICWQRQREIISNIWPTLKPGGLLIYSTCTYNTKENEENVRWISQEFGGETLAVTLKPDWNITPGFDESLQSYRFMPHKTKGEGFFVAVIRKPGQSESYCSTASTKQRKKKKRAVETNSSSAFGDLSAWVKEADSYQSLSLKETLYLFPISHSPELELMQKHRLHFIHIGLPLAYLKGSAIVPHHALSCSMLLNIDAFSRVEVSYEMAIAYLRKEAVTLPVTTSKGYVILTYRGLPLGFVKNIGNRSNNLYPSEWRIRSQRLPELVSTL